MYDLLIAAFQTDSTRVITYRQPGGSIFLQSIGVDVHPHDMSHYSTTRGEKLAASQKRDLTNSQLLAGLIDRITLNQVDAKQMPFPDAYFDVVLSNSIVHHIAEPLDVIVAEDAVAGIRAPVGQASRQARQLPQ